MTTTAVSFTSVSRGTAVLLRNNQQLTYVLSGTFVGTLQLAKSVDGGNSWAILKTKTAAATETITIDNKAEATALIRWQCTAYTSGTAVTSIVTIPFRVADLAAGEAELYENDGDTELWLNGAAVTSSNATVRQALLAADQTAIGSIVAIRASTLTNISAQIIAAQATLGATGGRIQLPAGVFYVQAVPLIAGIYYEGAGETVTQLKLPNGATSSMFVAAGDVLDAWGFRNIYFSGIYNSAFFGANSTSGSLLTRSTLNCLDFTLATNVQTGNIENCWFEYFNMAYAGAAASATNFDWYVTIQNCRFQYNNIGAFFGEHLHVVNSYFALNGTTNGSALTGGGAITGRANDWVCQKAWFLSNYAGIYPAAGKTIAHAQILGCGFFKQQTFDMKLFTGCVVSGNTFWADINFTSYAIVLTSGTNTITGNKFNEAGAPYLGALIQLLDSNSAVNFLALSITGNVFNCADTTAGPVLDLTGMTNGSSNLRGWTISGNSGSFNRTKLIKTSTSYLGSGSISGNTFTLSGDYTAATALALIDTYTAGADVISFTGNTAIALNKMSLFNGNSVGVACILMSGNTLYMSSTSAANLFIGGLNLAANGVQNNRGITTRNSGTAALTAATSVVVTHGLSYTPNIADIALTAQGACLTPPYVSTVTSTQFTINIAASTTANIGWVASCNN